MSEDKEALAGQIPQTTTVVAGVPKLPPGIDGYDVDDAGYYFIRWMDPQTGSIGEARWDDSAHIWQGTDPNDKPVWWDWKGTQHAGNPEGTKEFLDHKAAWEKQ